MNFQDNSKKDTPIAKDSLPLVPHVPQTTTTIKSFMAHLGLLTPLGFDDKEQTPLTGKESDMKEVDILAGGCFYLGCTSCNRKLWV